MRFGSQDILFVSMELVTWCVNAKKYNVCDTRVKQY